MHLSETIPDKSFVLPLKDMVSNNEEDTVSNTDTAW